MPFEELKERQSVMWGNGPYQNITETIEDIHDLVVERLAPAAGVRWLDLACGTGAVAERAAAAGAEVTGIDLAPGLIETARERATQLGLTIDYRVGDCEALDVVDEAFDVVSSTCGVMFAPDHGATARELVRVTKPGGRIVMGNWIPNDPTLVAQILKISASYSPPPPEGFVSPMTWGAGDEVTARFKAAGVSEDQISFEKATYTFNFPGSPSELVAEFKNYYGPTMNAFAAASKNGREDDLQTELEELFNEQNTSENGSTSIPATYLRVTVQR